MAIAAWTRLFFPVRPSVQQKITEVHVSAPCEMLVEGYGCRLHSWHSYSAKLNKKSLFWIKSKTKKKNKHSNCTSLEVTTARRGWAESYMSDLSCKTETFLIYELFTNLAWHLWICLGFVIVRILCVAFFSWWVIHCSFLLITTCASKQQSTVSISGSDHRAFYEQGTTASITNSKYTVFFSFSFL